MSTIRKENSMVRFAKGTRTALGQLTHMYRPELHRQVTERVPVSRLGQELTQLCQTGLGEPCDAGALAQARLELSELMDRILVSLKRNRVGLEILSPIMVHCFTHWHVTPETTVVCLLPVTFPKAKVVQKDIGQVLIKLPPDFTTTTTTIPKAAGGGDGGGSTARSSNPSALADVRSKDGLHVSPRKLHAALTRLVHGALLKHGVSEEQVEISGGVAPACGGGGGGGDLTMFVALECGWRAELVPCVAVTTAEGRGGGGGGGGGGGKGMRQKATARNVDVDAGVYYVSRRFHGESGCHHHHHHHEKGSHSGSGGGGGGGTGITWRPCFSAREQDLLHSISCTDNGLRLKAMHAICRMLSRDWRLEHLACYDVQTVLLHDMDFHVDYSPRWQRNTLESCVRSMLKTLLYFLERESLPHFDMNQLNLWENKARKQMSLARGALSRLLANENAFISLVRRASDAKSFRHSVDFGLLGY